MSAPDPYLPGHGDTRYRVHHYDLDLTYKVSTNRLEEKAVLDVEIAEPTAKIDVDLRGLQVKKVLVNGAAAKYTTSPTAFTVTVGQREPGERLTLTVHVAGKPGPVKGVHGDAGFEELTDGVMVGSQPNGASGWFPCNDDAANKATYRIAVTVNPEYHVVANGTLTDKQRVRGQQRWTYEMRYPMSPYLATLQIGMYRETPLEVPGVAVRASIVHPGRLTPGKDTAFAFQAQMIAHFTELFGLYPFDEYRAVIVDDELEIPLEAQSLSTFGRNFLAPTWENQRLVAHELAHQWCGNAVTGEVLADIWLHEGFACYAEWLWAEHRGLASRPNANHLAALHYADLPQPPLTHTLANPGMNHMFEDWVYKRGALTLHALRAEVGDALFFTILRTWVENNTGGTVSTKQFIDHCRAAAGESAPRVAELLDAWLHHRSIPPLPLVKGTAA